MTHTVLHIVHGYNAPFLDLSAHYNALIRQRGHQVVTLFLTGRADAAVADRCGADRTLFWELSTRQLRGMKLGVAARLRRLLHTEAVELIIAQRYKPLYLALLASIGRRSTPVIGVAHAFDVLRGSGRQRLLRWMAGRWSLLGVSDAVTADLRSAFPAGAKAIHTLHNCVAVGELKRCHKTRAEARATLGMSDEFLVANVGRLHPDKDQATLIRAFAQAAPQMPGAVVALIGAGRSEAAYRQLAASLGVADKVRFPGFVPDAPSLFPAFDLYVSTSDREPFGMVLTEAMAAHLPIISTDCGGAPEVVGGKGLYFKSGDSEALAQHLLAVYRMPPAEREVIGASLDRRVDSDFSFQTFQTKALALPIWPNWF